MNKPTCLFNAVGDGMVTYYRSLLPSQLLEADLLIQEGDSSPSMFLAPDGGDGTGKDYDLVIMQMPMQPWQPAQVEALKDTGAKILVNVDDYIHNLPDMKGQHELYKLFNSSHINAHERCIQLADGVICSTPWLQSRWSDTNRTYLCRNGLDLARYNVDPISLPRKMEDLIILGWSGAVGHLGSFGIIADVLSTILHEYDNVGLVTIGAQVFKKIHNRKKLRNRMKWYPWMSHWEYPEVMKTFDIGLAPSEENDFFRAKSQLRLYEYGACGIPTIGHPQTYDEIKHGETGFKADDEADWYKYIRSLIEDVQLRTDISRNIHTWTWTECGIGAREGEWNSAISSALA